MRKKLLAVLMTGAMVASFAGSATVVSAKSDDDNKLTVWAWDQNFNIKSMQIAADQYAKDHEGFSVDIIETSSDDCQTKLTTAANAGDYSTLPDIVLMQDNSYQKYLKSYPDAFTDLKDININWDDFGKLKQSYSMVDDTHYGVPFDNGAVIGAYRTDYLEQAGYTIDDLTDIDWNRFIEIAKDVKEKTGKYMLSGQADSPDMVMEMLQSAGASLFDKDGKPAMTDNAALKECISIYQKMVEEGVYYEVNNWDDYVSSITTGQVAGVINGNWISATIMGMKDTSGKWAITNMPKLIETPNATNYSNNGGSSWYITSNCKNKDLAIDFLKSTFAGSVKLYENILPTTGAIGTYVPAADSTAYQEPQEFWNNQPIFAKIVDFSLKTPTNNTSPYYYDGRNAIGTQIQNIMNGADVDQAIADAQAEVEFTMGE